MNTEVAVERLRSFVRKFCQAGVSDRKSFSSWARGNSTEMSDVFGYVEKEGMPPIYSLVTPFFHPKLPLVGLNYTKNAHATLHEFADGWTPVLRLCRGIVFDRDGVLVAMPFPKFFNYGEHAETSQLPRLYFEATAKYDGHLGIVFKYREKFIVTTRGDFMSRTSLLAKRLLDEYSKNANWSEVYPDGLTVLVEVIHPETQVYVDYGGQRKFVLIGAYNCRNLKDYTHFDLRALSVLLKLPVTETWSGQDVSDLVALMKDHSVKNHEGFVVRFSNGLRVKLKYESYIAKMVEDKLGYVYLMNRMIKGNLEKMLDTLPEEIYEIALRMLGEIMLAVTTPGLKKERWQSLYALQPVEKQTPYFRSVCRKFCAFIKGVE